MEASLSLHLKRHIRPVGAIASAVALMLAAGCSSSPKAPDTPAATPNPFSTSPTGSSDAVQINVLRAFGDSYTGEDYSSIYGTKNWTRELRGLVPITKIENYGYGGAKAADGEANSFSLQLSRWEKSGSAPSAQDLAIVYLGYNDIGRNGKPADQFAASKAGYNNGVARLVAGGATAGTNRVFVTQIHDWSRNPGVNAGNTKPLIDDWVNFVAGVANNNPNVIAVDLFTVFNRVMDNPAKFGIVNVTDSDASRSRTDYLFYDSIHFGNRGQEMIARTYKHYLTRAWSWASALEAGVATATRVGQDMDNNLVFAYQQAQANPSSSRFRLVPLTTQQTDQRDRLQRQVFDHHLIKKDASSGFDQARANGLAFDVDSQWLGIAAGGRMGMAFSQNAQSMKLTDAEERHSTRFTSNAASLYWMQPYGRFLFSTQLSRFDHAFDQSGQDDLLARSVQNGRSANTWAFESKLRYTFRSGPAVITPWFSLSQQRHTLDAGVAQSLYTTDVSYAQAKARDVFSGIGFDVQADPIALSGASKLYLGGGINHMQSASRDMLTVGMREAIAPSVNVSETIPRERIRRTQLALNAQLELTKSLRMGAAYAVDLQKPGETQSVRLTAGLQF